MRVHRPTNMIPIAAITESTGPIDHIKPHRGRTEVPFPIGVFPARSQARACRVLAIAWFTTVHIAGAKFLFIGATFKRTGLHIHDVRAEEHAPVI